MNEYNNEDFDKIEVSEYLGGETLRYKDEINDEKKTTLDHNKGIKNDLKNYIIEQKKLIKDTKIESRDTINNLKKSIKYNNIFEKDVNDLSNDLNLSPVIYSNSENTYVSFNFKDNEVFDFPMESFTSEEYQKGDIFKAFREYESESHLLKTKFSDIEKVRKKYNNLPLNSLNRNLDNILGGNNHFGIKTKALGEKVGTTIGNLFLSASAYTLASNLTSKLNTEVIAEYTEKMQPLMQDVSNIGLNYAIPALIGVGTLYKLYSDKKNNPK